MLTRFCSLLVVVWVSLVFGPAPGLASDWARLDVEVLSTADPQASKVRLSPKSADAPPVEAHVVVFDPAKLTLRIVDDPDKKLKNLRAAMEQIGAVAGV